MSAIEIIRTIYDAGATTKNTMIDTLRDGEALQAIGITDQADVDDAYAIVRDSDIDDYLDIGGTIGDYQW